MITSNWITLLLLCTSAPSLLYCDYFVTGSGLRQVKREPVDLVTEDYDVSLCQGIMGISVGKGLKKKR